MNMNELGLPNDIAEAAHTIVIENKESAKMYLELQMDIYDVPNTEILLSKVEVRNVMAKKNFEMLPMSSNFERNASSASNELEKTKLALNFTGHFKSENK